MTEYLTAAEIAERNLPEMPATRNAVNNWINDRDWRTAVDAAGNPLAKKVGNGWAYHRSLLPLAAQAKLTEADKAEEEANAEAKRSAQWGRYERLTTKQKEKAQQKMAILVAVDALTKGGTTVNLSVATIAKANDVSPRSIFNWQKMVSGVPQTDWLPALAPRHVGRTKQAECPPEAWEMIKTDWLRLARPSFETCYNRLQRTAAERGWVIPSAKALKRRIEREIPKPVIVKLRQGEEALKQMFPAQERRRDHFHAMEAVNVDGHRWDVFVKWPDGTIDRPMMVAIQDLYSGKILAWRLDRTENVDVVRLAFKDTFEQWGIPHDCYLDNGRAFASKYISGGSTTRFRFKVKADEPTGVLTALNIQMHWATPYSGQSKPIERAFRDLCDSIAKHPAFDGAYTGNSPTAKPENYGNAAVPLDRFIEVIDQEIHAHNARPGRRSFVCGGIKSFDQAFDESYASAAIQMPTEEQLRLCLLAAESVTANRRDGSIKLLDNRFWSPALHEIAGTKAVIRFDPDQVQSGIYVYRLDGSYIGFADCIHAVGFDSKEAGRQHQRDRAAFVRKTKEQAKAASKLTPEQVVAMLPKAHGPAPVDAKVTRLINPNTNMPNRVRRPMPEPAQLSDEAAAAHDRLVEEMEAANVVALPETKEQRFKRAKALENAIENGEDVDADKARWLGGYQTQPEYRSMQRMFEDFGPDWLKGEAQ